MSRDAGGPRHGESKPGIQLPTPTVFNGITIVVGGSPVSGRDGPTQIESFAGARYHLFADRLPHHPPDGRARAKASAILLGLSSRHHSYESLSGFQHR
jgi:hypothetical protein